MIFEYSVRFLRMWAPPRARCSWVEKPILRRPPLSPLPARRGFKSWCSSPTTGQRIFRRVNRWVLALGVATLLLGLVLAVAISRSVTRPLETLVAGTRALGQGDFDYELRVDGAAEVRELALAFDRMRGELKRTHRELIESDRLATIGRMASSVSHDLRHHLSAIYANAEFMSLPNTGADERGRIASRSAGKPCRA